MSLPYVGLSKSVRVFTQNGQYLLKERFVPPQKCGIHKFNHAMCHTQGRGGQYSSEESIHSDGKAEEAGYGHINGTLQEGATL